MRAEFCFVISSDITHCVLGLEVGEGKSQVPFARSG